MFPPFHSSFLFRPLWFLQHHSFYLSAQWICCFSFSIFLFNEVHWVTASSAPLFHFNLFIWRHSYHLEHFSHCCCLHKVWEEIKFISIPLSLQTETLPSLYFPTSLRSFWTIHFQLYSMPSFLSFLNPTQSPSFHLQTKAALLTFCHKQFPHKFTFDYFIKLDFIVN